MRKLLSILILSLLPVLMYGQQWILMGEDSICDRGEVYTLYNLNDTVYASGDFQYYGPMHDSMWHIGYYCNSEWHTMSYGLWDSNGAQTIIKYEDYLYVGGSLIQALTSTPFPFAGWNIPNTENASRWNFSTQEFEALPSATGKYINSGSTVYDFCIYHDTLFMAGYCGVLESDGNTVFSWRIVAYDGTDFINVGALPELSMQIETFNDEVYVTGAWYGSVKKWNRGTGTYNYNAWDDVLITNNYPAAYDMEVDTFNNFLYLAGGCNLIYDPLTNRKDTGNGVVRYDGFVWEAIGSKTDYSYPSAKSVGLYRNELFVGRVFDTIDNVTINGVAKWDDINDTWVPLGNGVDIGWGSGAAYDFLELNDTLWVGGGFYLVDSIPNGPIARWYEPAVPCAYIKPRVQCIQDTFKINDQQPTTEVQFFNNNAYADSWEWDFDDGGASANTKDASHIFDTPGTYSVSVTVSHNSCIKTATRDIVIINNTGEDELSKESLKFKLFPNPTSGAVSVECTLPQDKTGEIRTHLANGAYKNSYKLQSGFNHLVIPAEDINYGLSMVSLFVEGEYIFSEKVIKE